LVKSRLRHATKLKAAQTLCGLAGQLALYRVAVEKLLPAKFAKIKIPSESPINDFLDFQDILHPPNFGCLGGN